MSRFERIGLLMLLCAMYAECIDTHGLSLFSYLWHG